MYKASIKSMRLSGFMCVLQFTNFRVVVPLIFGEVLRPPVRRTALTIKQGVYSSWFNLCQPSDLLLHKSRQSLSHFLLSFAVLFMSPFLSCCCICPAILLMAARPTIITALAQLLKVVTRSLYQLGVVFGCPSACCSGKKQE